MLVELTSVGDGRVTTNAVMLYTEACITTARFGVLVETTYRREEVVRRVLQFR